MSVQCPSNVQKVWQLSVQKLSKTDFVQTLSKAKNAVFCNVKKGLGKGWAVPQAGPKILEFELNLESLCVDPVANFGTL